MPDFHAAREYADLRTAQAEADAVFAWPDERLFRVAPSVSGWSAAGHLYHVARTNALTLRALARIARGAADASGGLTRVGTAALGRGRFPRGIAKAPPMVTPPDDLDRAALAEALDRCRTGIEGLEAEVDAMAGLTGRMPHPYFGDLGAADWVRFMVVHTRHHLAIVREVDAAREDASEA